MKQVTPNVFVEINKHGCNTIFVVTSEGVLAHDSPIRWEKAKEWPLEIAKYGEVRYVISGEPHTDHIRGLCCLGGTLIGCDGSREEILRINERYKKGLYKVDAPSDSDFYFRTPDIEIKGNITIHLGKHTFEIFMMPGHTPWNMCTYVPEERVILTSDTITGDPPVLHDAVPGEWLESLAFMQTLDFDTIIPGHGDVMQKSAIKGFMQEIHTWVDPVEDAIKKGKSLEWAKKNITMEKEYPGLAEKFPWEPDIVPDSIAQIYNYLINRKKNAA